LMSDDAEVTFKSWLRMTLSSACMQSKRPRALMECILSNSEML
jgi:hypothetical protein